MTQLHAVLRAGDAGRSQTSAPRRRRSTRATKALGPFADAADDRAHARSATRPQKARRRLVQSDPLIKQIRKLAKSRRAGGRRTSRSCSLAFDKRGGFKNLLKFVYQRRRRVQRLRPVRPLPARVPADHQLHRLRQPRPRRLRRQLHAADRRHAAKATPEARGRERDRRPRQPQQATTQERRRAEHRAALGRAAARRCRRSRRPRRRRPRRRSATEPSAPPTRPSRRRAPARPGGRRPTAERPRGQMRDARACSTSSSARRHEHGEAAR